MTTTPTDPTIDVTLYSLMAQLEEANAQYRESHGLAQTNGMAIRLLRGRTVTFARQHLSQYLATRPNVAGHEAARKLLHDP